MTSEDHRKYERSVAIVKPMENAMRRAILDVIKCHSGVSSAEIAKILSEESTNWIRYAIQDERGETGK